MGGKRVKNKDENTEWSQRTGGRGRNHTRLIEYLQLSRYGDKRGLRISALKGRMVPEERDGGEANLYRESQGQTWAWAGHQLNNTGTLMTESR